MVMKDIFAKKIKIFLTKHLNGSTRSTFIFGTPFTKHQGDSDTLLAIDTIQWCYGGIRRTRTMKRRRYLSRLLEKGLKMYVDLCDCKVQVFYHANIFPLKPKSNNSVNSILIQSQRNIFLSKKGIDTNLCYIPSLNVRDFDTPPTIETLQLVMWNKKSR